MIAAESEKPGHVENLANRGLPPLNLGSQPYSYFEFWPAWFFYTPVVIYWLMLGARYRSLGLPLLANPRIPLGGMVGESKAAILDMAGERARAFILPFLKFRYDGQVSAAGYLEYCSQAGLALPLVIKPDLGCRGTGVRLIANQQQLQAYLRAFPKGRDFLIQKLAPYHAEAGVFYVRQPGAAAGTVTSITLKYQPVLLGDGKKKLAELIASDTRARKLSEVYGKRLQAQLARVPAKGEAVVLGFAGSHARGSIFRNGNQYISPAFTAAIDDVMRDFPEFHYGRLDIKFESIEALKCGKSFVIIEVNGASSEATHIWDSRTRLSDVFFTLFWQYRTLFSIGQQLRHTGHKVPSIWCLLKTAWREWRQGKVYPSSN